MTRHFHHELEALKGRVVAMGGLARQNVLDAVNALLELDQELARKVIAREDQLNRMDVEIERDILDLLALNQPVAQDLRTAGASLKIITYVDRIGRYGYDIAKVVRKMEGAQHIRKPVAFLPMAEAGMRMLDAALEAYRDRDAAKARSVPPLDEVVDGLYDQVFRDCVTHMMEDPRTISLSAHYILVARHLERVADHANKIAEKTLYMITGERRLQV
ncbi:MAG: phosphate transport system protein [Thermoplasmata archaeon]|jgi:phosphate transport system protein|nr:phosphate transport system protein [Thermoplasmata archaeon]